MDSIQKHTSWLSFCKILDLLCDGYMYLRDFVAKHRIIFLPSPLLLFLALNKNAKLFKIVFKDGFYFTL